MNCGQKLENNNGERKIIFRNQIYKFLKRNFVLILTAGKNLKTVEKSKIFPVDNIFHFYRQIFNLLSVVKNLKTMEINSFL